MPKGVRSGIFLLACLLTLTFAPVSQAAPKTFPNCEALNKIFPFGIAKSYKAASNAFRLGVERPPVRPKLYKANLKKSPKLDKPPNGILCEVPIDDGLIESDLAWQKVVQDIRAVIQRTPPSPTRFDLRFDPNILPTRQSDTQQVLQETYAVFETFAPSTPNFPLLIMNGNSFVWYQDQLKNFPNNNCLYQDQESWTVGVSALGDGARSGAVCWSSRGPFGIFVLGSLSGPRDSTWLFAHEGTHFAQHLLFGRNLGIETDSLPSWLPEGQAVLYQLALDDEFSLEAIQVSRQRTIDSLVNTSGLGTNASSADWQKFLADTETIRGNHEYSLGLLMTERLYADFGETAVMDWIRTSGAMPWQAAFENQFGVSVQSWYESSAIPYLMAQTQRQ